MSNNNNNNPIRILLANDQELLRNGLRMMFESETDLELVAVTDNFEDTLALTQQYSPDLILFDSMLQEKHCIELKEELQSTDMSSNSCLSCKNCLERIPELRNVSPSSKILILTACLNQENHILALRQGAIGVFPLHQPIELLSKAIHKVYAGEVWLTNSLANKVLKGFSHPACPPEVIVPAANSLTSRELTIARLVAEGYKAKQIAKQLFVSEKTIRNQLVTIYSKLGIQNHIELMLHALALGLKKPN